MRRKRGLQSGRTDRARHLPAVQQRWSASQTGGVVVAVAEQSVTGAGSSAQVVAGALIEDGGLRGLAAVTRVQHMFRLADLCRVEPT